MQIINIDINVRLEINLLCVSKQNVSDDYEDYDIENRGGDKKHSEEGPPEPLCLCYSCDLSGPIH